MHFAGQYVAPRPGPIFEVDSGSRVGRHNGLWTYTIGQCAKLSSIPTRLFVASKDREKNAIYVALPESVQT